MSLCCGEALIDMLPVQTEGGQLAFAPHVGGAVFNTAVGLGRLEAEVGMFSGVSNDLFGSKLLAALKASNVDTSSIVLSDLPSTLAFVTLDEGHARYTFYDENSAGRMLKTSDIPVLSGDVTALFFGGISLACEPCADIYASLCVQASTSNVIMLDRNYWQR